MPLLEEPPWSTFAAVDRGCVLKAGSTHSPAPAWLSCLHSMPSRAPACPAPPQCSSQDAFPAGVVHSFDGRLEELQQILQHDKLRWVAGLTPGARSSGG